MVQSLLLFVLPVSYLLHIILALFCLNVMYTYTKIGFVFIKLYILVIGDEKNQIHMEGYQVSNQCTALVRDGCLVPTKEAPELGYVIESTDKQYVPDVFYKVSSFIIFEYFRFFWFNLLVQIKVVI